MKEGIAVRAPVAGRTAHAVVILFGQLTSTALTMVVLPALCRRSGVARQERREPSFTPAEAQAGNGNRE